MFRVKLTLVISAMLSVFNFFFFLFLGNSGSVLPVKRKPEKLLHLKIKVHFFMRELLSVTFWSHEVGFQYCDLAWSWTPFLTNI